MMSLARRAAAPALALVVVAASLAACQGGPAPPPPGPPQPTSFRASDYRLGATDRLRVIVYGEDNLSGEFNVSPSGKLSLPLIGDVAATGRSVADVQAEITQRLSRGYLKDPRVSVEVLTFRPFYILGEVNKPGLYPFAPGLTVQGAVATAQGYTYRADVKHVFIKHAQDRVEHAYPMTSSLLVQPNDVIRFGERFF